jgi:hypothetical protein
MQPQFATVLPLTALFLFMFSLREQPVVPESVVSAAEGLSSLIQTSPAPSTPSKSFVSKRKRYAQLLYTMSTSRGGL